MIEKCIELVGEEGEDIILAEGFDDAFLGVVNRAGEKFALYDEDKCLEILEKGGMSHAEAIEFMDYNVLCVFYGVTAPGYLTRCSLEDLDESNR